MNVLSLIPRVFFFGLCSRRIRLAVCFYLGLILPAPLLAANTIVGMETSLGSFVIELYDDDAPLTVTNFLNYVTRGDYNNTVIHRSIPGFVIQGGGYEYSTFFGQIFHISTEMPVQNEYDPARSNIRSTIAMAKQGGDPNSATSEWFFNLADNSANLDYQNEGFTVFGHVLDSGMDIVDAAAALPTSTQGAYSEDFQYLTLGDFPKLGNNFVFVNRVCISIDVDASCSETEDLAQGGDGNGDGTPDREQGNVTTFLTSLNGVATLAADTGMRFSSITAIDKDTALSWLKKFTSPPNQTLHFNNGTLRFTMVGTISADGKKTVTLHDGTATRPAYYYAYGPTADNPTPHWYDFSYDGETGAEITNDRITLHFVDGKRGDDDYTANGSVTHTGAQAVVTSTTTSSSPASGGCSISTAPRDTLRAGDWMLVSMFLAMLALAHRYGRRH